MNQYSSLEGRTFHPLTSCIPAFITLSFVSLIPKASIIARKKEAAAEKLQEAMDEVADR